MLWRKYNNVSHSQLLDNAVKDNPAWPYGKVQEKACFHELDWKSGPVLDVNSSLVMQQDFLQKTPSFFSPFLTRPPPLPLSCVYLLYIRHGVYELELGCKRGVSPSISIYVYLFLSVKVLDVLY